ncbi:putative toxin-antitoxin system toxin component, PIN family [Azospirillum thermophilum]|uniref:Putative toxin-antitoxin system toxin component, PIN family n=1 Tax=Azospirillum thermophilum TaxID=2202148 RepID=A0A2S2CSC0_9PROT|nr:putative toxin-antitoxin system toxin component, PIN family [Azospirillum thermophilum]AWK87423.1 putative toxin-antitoxin system toxin component, PIN family [Azospirillum thermophilum]
MTQPIPQPDPAARQEVPLRAVLDTNILVAYALLDGGDLRRHAAIRRTVERVRAAGGLLGSAATMAELHGVLMRPGFDRYRPAAERRRFLAEIAAEVRLVEPASVARLCRDPEDDMFLAVALAAGSPWLVTVDKQLLAVRGVGRTRVLRPERFLDAVENPPRPTA